MKELRAYQLEDAVRLAKAKVSGCFNEQRTGKTPTIISTLKILSYEQVVIVCPKTALYIWADELHEWYPTINIYVVSGVAKDSVIKDWSIEKGILIINYDTLKLPNYLMPVIYGKAQCLILDEAHRIRNRKTQTSKACITLGKTIPSRYALTGTPVMGTVDDIWCILHFLFPEKFKSYWNWVDTWCTTGVIYDKRGNPHTQVIGLKHELRTEYARFLNTIATNRKRKDIMPWLPDKDRQTIKLPLSSQQRKYLKELAETYETDNLITKCSLDRLIRYRQICLHPGLLELKGTSPKQDWIIDYLKDYPDESIIIFSNFTEWLKLLQKSISESALIIGSTTPKERTALVERFQKKQLKVLLINIKAGKEALTLDAGDTIIFTDKYPPVGDIEQAEDRFVATTKDKATKQHKIITLVMKQSYDEEITKLIDKRATEADVINNFKKYLKL